MASISLKNVSKSFGKTEVLKDITLDVKDKEFMVLLGPSGCGKTTLLNVIAGLEPESSGEIIIDGKKVNDISPGERDVGFVFQNYALYPNKTVYGNLAFGLKFKKTSATEFDDYKKEDKSESKKALIDHRVQDIAKILQINKLLDAKPFQLSGGQRQRVAMGRAMVRKPKVYLFDEPLSNLDAILRVYMREEIKEIHRKVETTIVYVTHDQIEAMTLADRIVVINEGKILQAGTPNGIYDFPANTFVASFVGNPPMNLLETKIEEENGRICFNLSIQKIVFPAIFQDELRKYINCDIIFGIRPENIALNDLYTVSSKVKAKVASTDFLGNTALIHAELGKNKLIIATEKHQTFQRGENINIFLDMQKFHLFDKITEKRISR